MTIDEAYQCSFQVIPAKRKIVFPVSMIFDGVWCPNAKDNALARMGKRSDELFPMLSSQHVYLPQQQSRAEPGILRTSRETILSFIELTW
jgi:hypothetical protein